MARAISAKLTYLYAELAPDLLAEILSPDDRPAEVLAKVADWLAAGTKIVWVVDPERREARVRPRLAYSLSGLHLDIQQKLF